MAKGQISGLISCAPAFSPPSPILSPPVISLAFPPIVNGVQR